MADRPMHVTQPVALLFRELEQSEEALGTARDELEKRVKARTAELRAANEALQPIWPVPALDKEPGGVVYTLPGYGNDGEDRRA